MTNFRRKLKWIVAAALLAVVSPCRLIASDSLAVVSEFLQDELIKANDDFWTEQNRKDIDLLRAQLRAKSKKETHAANSALNETQTAYISTLEIVIATQGSNSVRLRAQIELAVFYFYELGDLKNARTTLSKFDVNADDVQPDLMVKYLILSSDISFKNSEFKASQNLLLQADKFVNEHSLSDEFEGPLSLRLANASFSCFEYEKAIVFYKRYLTHAVTSSNSFVRDGVLFAKARMVSSWFKLGEYKRVVEFSSAYLSQIRSDNRENMKELTNDVMTITSVALYERFDKTDFLKILRNDAGAESFETVVRAFERVMNAGRVDELDGLATFVESSFASSSFAVRFYDIWLSSLKQNGRMDRWAAIAYRALKVATKGTPLARDVAQNTLLAKQRAQFVVNMGNEAGEFYYLRAKNFNDESDFALCADVYNMRSSEAEVLFGEHAIRYAECLYGVKQYELAWQQSELTLKRPLSRAQSLALFDVRVLIARDASGASPADFALLSRYQKSVDLFLSAFSSEYSARSGGYELSQKLIGLEKIQEAKHLLERLVSILPSNGSVQDNELRDKIIVSLSLLNARGSHLVDDITSQSKLEAYARKLELDDSVLDEVQAANSASIRLLVSQFRREGRFIEAAQALREWCIHHKQNVESSAVCLDSIRALAEIGSMWQVSQISEYLLKVYPNASERFEAWYWLGKAFEHRFAFDKALSAYSQAVLVKDSKLTDKKRTDLLESAQAIAFELKNYVMAARFQEELLNHHIKVGKELNRFAKWALVSSGSWVKANRLDLASRPLKSVYLNSKFSVGNRFKTQLADITLDLNNPLRRVEGRARLDAFIETTSKRLNDQAVDEASREFLNQALALAFSTDIFEFDLLDADASSMLSDSGLKKRVVTLDASLNRFEKVEGYLNPDIRKNVLKHMSRLSERLSDIYNLVARRSSTTARQEEYARSADAYLLQARKFEFESIGENSRWDNKTEPDFPIMTPGESIARRKQDTRRIDKTEVSR